MPYTNNKKKIFDIPFWLPTAQFRTATSAIGAMQDDKERYIYTTLGGLFYKYDTWTDVHIRLATPNIAPVTKSTMVYSQFFGHNHFVLSADISSITTAVPNADSLVGNTLFIMDGTGEGQSMTISSVDRTNILEYGILTSVTANSITDTTKRWEINQFIGYQVRVVFGTGASQIRKVLYNDSTTLTFYDINFHQLDPWNNSPLSAIAPYSLPVTTAGLQGHYQIESTKLNFSATFSITPNVSSKFTINTGTVFLLSAAGGAPFSTFQAYDVLTDSWTTRTALGGNLLAALGTDFSLTRVKGYVHLSGTVSSGTIKTLSDNTVNLEVNRFTNYKISSLDTNKVYQTNIIASNGTGSFETKVPWAATPSGVYYVMPDYDKLYLTGNNAASMYQYSLEYDAWYNGPLITGGQTRNASVRFGVDEATAISTAVRNTGGITSLSITPTAAGTGYAVGDLFNITTGGTVGKGRVKKIGTGGLVVEVVLYSAGLTYTTGTGKATTNISGSGTGLTVNILTIGTVGRITTATNYNFYNGDTIILTGANEAAWNGSYTILAIDSLNTFDLIVTATTTLVPSFTNTTTLIVDSTKTWATNEHIGKIIKVDTSGPSPTSQYRRITSNTATTITVAALGVAAVSGTSRYIIFETESFGRDMQYKDKLLGASGVATGGSSTTLVDTSKQWIVDQWAGYRMRVMSGSGAGSEVVISSNTIDTLTLTTPGFTSDITTNYNIMDSYGTATATGTTTTITDSTKRWIVNQWAGKRLVITSGTGQRSETSIVSNTSTVLTFTAIAANPDVTTTYVILFMNTRLSGGYLAAIDANSNISTKSKYLISFRGGGTNLIDRYDITTTKCESILPYTPQSEVINTGVSYGYYNDKIYFSIGTLVNDFIYILELDVNTLEVNGIGQTTALQGTVHIGDLMSVLTSPDGGVFMYLGINSSRLMYRTLIN